MSRQSIVRVAAVVVLLVALSGCDWTMFRGGPAHTGSNPAETRVGTANVAGLTARFTGELPGEAAARSEPATANGIVYVGGEGTLSAFDADGQTGCAAPTPRTCAPLWTMVGGRGSPAVGNGFVFSRSTNAQGFASIAAFDAAGVKGCSGVPKQCRPVWEGTIGLLSTEPTLANGVVYITTNAGTQGVRLSAFDAAGVTWCSGAPKTCQPLWTASDAYGPVVVANGLAIVPVKGKLNAYDATGAKGCSGLPRVCTPLWTATGYAGAAVFPDVWSPAVANGTLYAIGDAKLYAFDATGTTGCSGAPKVCQPRWAAAAPGVLAWSPAVANGTVYAGAVDGRLYAFDAAGAVGCSGTPKTCAPKWSAANGSGAPVVANGVVYSGAGVGQLHAFDAAGSVRCSGTPKSCSPLWSASVTNVEGTPTIAAGFVYLELGPRCAGFACTQPSVVAFSMPE